MAQAISLVPQELPPFRSWSTFTYDQLIHSMSRLHEEIRLSVMEQKPKLKLLLRGVVFDVTLFKGSLPLMWTHRCIGISCDGSRSVEFLICEVGRPETVLAQGKLRFVPTEI